MDTPNTHAPERPTLDQLEVSVRYAEHDTHQVVNELSEFLHPRLLSKLTQAIEMEREQRAAFSREHTGKAHPADYHLHPRVR